MIVSVSELANVLLDHNLNVDHNKLFEIYDMLDLELIEDAIYTSDSIEDAIRINPAIKNQLIKEQLIELGII
jgi:hypothetical protein